ncbi:MAG TPA: protease inhibitor I42 family protein [Bacillota bacterium]|nr:protease inhibitor I42 family protein [Bacillota bacterium]
MNRRFMQQVLIGLLLVGTLLLSLGGRGLAMNDSDTVLIGWEDNGKTISLNEGQVVHLALAANPGTGYGWIFNQSPQESVIKYITHYEQPNGTLAGSSVTENWFFYCLAPGKTAIELKYARSWEPKAIKTFTVTLLCSKEVK